MDSTQAREQCKTYTVVKDTSKGQCQNSNSEKYGNTQTTYTIAMESMREEIYE